MTAVVGILNKQAVALAADSAVTISGSNSRKILNNANKIFRISNRAPVGLMIYNSAALMTTPWEIIIKVFREHLADEQLPTIKDYQARFITFLSEKQFFASPDIQNLALFEFAVSIFEQINRDALAAILPINLQQTSPETSLSLILTNIDKVHAKLEAEPLQNITTAFEDLTFDAFKNASSIQIDEAVRDRYFNHGFQLDPERVQKLSEIIFRLLRSGNFLNNYTGLVFAGYGKEEIFPSLLPIQVSFAWQNRLRWLVDENAGATISPSMISAIRPFAQTDVINTILTGIDPNLQNFFIQNFGTFLEKYNRLIQHAVAGQPVAEQLQNISIQNLLNEYISEMTRLQQQNYIQPLMNAVATLSKDDLAEMAESLIYLTYLKRRITFAEESVGGPVDVAIISKGDGFIWKKRKHYFKPELNPHFFANYLR